jgi:hypothetical protein
VNIWLWAATVLLVAVLPLLLVAVRGDPMEGLVAMQAVSVVGALVLLVLTVGFDRSGYGIVAVVLSAFSVAGMLAFVRLMERWV